MTALAERTAPSDDRHAVDVEIVVPVFNEEADLEPSVRRLHAFLRRRLPVHARSSPSPTTPAPTATWPRAAAAGRRTRPACAPCTWTPRAAAARCSRCGRAARPASSPTWTSTCRPTSPRCCRWSRRCCPGTATSPSARRLSRSSRVVRGPKREFISRCYNLLLRTTLRARFSDAQCGFKAMRDRVRARAAAARARHGLVLRHRTAGAGRAQRPAHRRGAGRLGRRPGQPGRHRARPRWPTCAASPGSAARWRAATCRCASCAQQSAATRSTVPGVPRRLAGRRCASARSAC